MNRLHRLPLLLLTGLGCLAQATAIHAQEAEEGDDQRVQYQLVLPDEKTPENVKPEEHNPFESESEAQDRMSPGDTEENRVRDLLLRLKVAGTTRMRDGRMRVMLGNLILETGKAVPPVLPDQQVELKVKNITPEAIELAWQEKRATGLPPKLMIIPINTSPRVRYQMLGQNIEESKGGVNASMEMKLRQATTQLVPPPPVASSPPAQAQEPQPLPAELVMDAPPAATPADPALSAAPPALETPAAAVPEPAPVPPSLMLATPVPVASPATGLTAPPAVPEAPNAERPAPVAPVPPPLEPPPEEPPAPKPPTPPPSPAVESVVRMLFGNPPPENPPPAPK